MPLPAFVTPSAASRIISGVGMNDADFPRAAASVPNHRRNGGAPVVAASAGVTSFEAGAVPTQKRKRTPSTGGRETAFGVSRAFRGNPLAPFCTSQNAEDDANVKDGEHGFPSDPRGHGSLESARLSTALSAGPAPTAETPLQPLAAVASIPVGSLLLGVVAEVHSDDILVHLPDGLVGWVPRAHAFASLEDRLGDSGSGNRESGSVRGKRCRKDVARSTVGAERNQASPRVATDTADAAGTEDTRQTATKQRAPVCSSRRVERPASLTSHYGVGQVVQCVVIADGEKEWPQTPGHLRRGSGQTLVLSLRPSIFNAGLTVEAIQPGMVLPASLSSVEDHGYAFSLGIKGLSAFLPSSALQRRLSACTDAPRADDLAASTTPLSLPLHTVVSLRVDSVNAAAKVLLCSLPGTEEQGRQESESTGHLSRWQRERYLALSKAVAWAAVKPGCLIEARVQEICTWKDRDERSRNPAGTLRRLREGKKSSAAIGSENMDEMGSQNVRGVVGVRVVCMGGDVVGTLLQPHFGHPLLGLENKCCPYSQTRVAADGGTKDRKRKKNAVEDAAKGAPNEDGQGSRGRGHHRDCSSENCVGSSGGADVERRLTRKAGGTLSDPAGDSAPDGARFEVIQARYSQMCSSRLTRVGARIFARVTCVLSSSTRHVYLSMLPHIMMWRPCQLPCSVPELLPGRRLLAETARVISVFPAMDALSRKTSALRRHSSSSSHDGVGDGQVRVLLQQKRCAEGASHVSRLSPQKKNKRPRLQTELARETSSPSQDADQSFVTGNPEDATEDIGEHSGLPSQTSAGCEMNGAVSRSEASVYMSGEQGQSCPWILVRIPRCMMAAVKERSSSDRTRNRGSKRRVEADAETKQNEECALSDMAPGDVLWSASQGTDDGDCFCRVLYFDRFAAEVVGGNAPRLLKDNVILTPFDVSPGQIITVSVLRWRLPAESDNLKHQKRAKRSQGPAAGIFVGLSPYLTAFVPLHQLMDTPVTSFPPHVVPGCSLKLRVLERVCCGSCTSLDRDSIFAAFLSRSGHKRAVKRQLGAGTSDARIFQLRDGATFYSDGHASGSSVMGMGGGGGGRLVLTGKKSFLKDPHPLASIVAPRSSRGRMHNGRPSYLQMGLIALGYVREVIYTEAASGAERGRGRVEGSEERLPSVTVGFYGGLTARLPHDEVRRAIVEEGRTFKLGTVVKVRMVGVDTKHRCLRVTMDMSSEVVQAAIAAARRREEKVALCLSPGVVIEKQRLTLLAVTEEGVLVAVEEKTGDDAAHTSPNAVESVCNTDTSAAAAKSCVDKSQYREPKCPPVVGLGYIPKMHLSDGVRLAEELYGLLQVGKKFPLDAVVLSSAATVRPGAAVQMWEPRKASFKEEGIRSGRGSAGRAASGHSEGGIEDVLARVKQGLNQPPTVEGDGLENEHTVEAFIRDVTILSCKPSLRVSAVNGTFLRDTKAIEKLKTKLLSSPPIMWGYVRKIGAYGLLVSFGAWQLTGLLPYSNISDAFIEDENHLRQLYREGMTVRGCLVALSDAADEESEHEPSDHANTSSRVGGATGKRGALRFLVDIRPKRLSDLQRHQLLREDTRAAALGGIQMLRGLFEQKSIAAMLQQSTGSHERLAETVMTDCPEPVQCTLNKATFASESAGDSAPLVVMDSVVCLRPGQLVWGRILPQDFPNCILLELQWPRREHNTTCRFYSIKGVTGIVLEHQLPEGETIASLRARTRGSAYQKPIPCLVLDFDPVSGIADVSCRRRLVKPLHVAHNVVEAAARRQENSYVHYILIGISTPPSRDHITKDLHGIPLRTKGAAGRSGVKNRRTEVVTQDLNGLLRGDTAVFESQSESAGSLPSAVLTSHVETGGVRYERKATEQIKEVLVSAPVEAIPEKVIRRIHSFCEAQPVACATVQLESATYSVLSADFDLVIYFSENKHFRQERLEAVLSYAAHAGNDGETAKLLRVMPDGRAGVDTSQMGKSATHFTGGSCLADGLFVRLPVMVLSTSCHNNTLVPVQPTASALQEAPEDAGWRVSLSPVQRPLYLQSSSFGFSALLAGGCWPSRECRLEQQRQQNRTPSQRRAGEKATDGFGGKSDSTELSNNKISTEKKLWASELDDAIERAAAPGQILRARITHVGACVAFARLKKPKQQLLLRLHAADALPLSVQIQQRAGDALSQGEDWNREDCACPKTEPQPPGKPENEPGATSTGEERHCGRESGRTGWFPPVLSRSASLTGRSACSGNPLKRLIPGMFVEVKVLRLREVRSVPCEKAGHRGRFAAPRGAKACEEHSAHNYEEGDTVTKKKSKQEGDTVPSTKNQWVADVELVGLLERQRAGGRVLRSRYTRVSGELSASLTSHSMHDSDRFSGEVEKSKCESKMTRNMLTWLYAPRWAVVEAVCHRYLTIHCGVRSEVLGNLSLQQATKGDSKENERTKVCSPHEGPVYYPTYLSGRGRVHRLDATQERGVLQDLKVGFAPGDMVCVRPLPVLTLEEAAFEEALESETRAATRANEETPRSNRTTPDTKHCRRNTLRTASFVARYTVVGVAADSAEKLTQYAAEAEGELMTDESDAATSVHSWGAIPLSLIETSFDTMAHALDAWARWRYSPGLVCWGLVHHLLRPPFAVAVQVCEVVVKRRILPLLKTKSESCGGRDVPQVADKEDGHQSSGVKLASSGGADSALRVPVLAAVHLTEITDAWQSDPVKHLKLTVGQLVKVRIMPILKTLQAQQELKYKTTESRSGLPLEASLRLSVVEDKLRPRTGEESSRPLAFDQLKVGDRVSGYVISTGDAGVFVAISRCLTVRIKLQNLCCSTVSMQEESQETHSTFCGLVSGAQAQKLYPVGKVLRGITVVELHPDTRRVEGSLKDETWGVSKSRSVCNDEHMPANKRRKNNADTNVARPGSGDDPVGLVVGDVCEGRVKAIESFGVFVSLLLSPRRRSGRERTIDALCHISDIGGATAEERTSTLGKLKAGDLVKARVIRTDAVTGRIWITLDTSVFESEENLKSELDGVQGEAASGELAKYSEPLGGMISTLKCTATGEYANEEDPRSATESVRTELAKDTESLYAVEESRGAWSASISGFDGVSDEECEGLGDRSKDCQGELMRDWQGGTQVTEWGLRRNAEVEEMCEDASENTTRHEEEQRRKKEEEIRLAEEESSSRSWMENPRTPEDFEKLILVSGNSATVWIGYMAYYLKLGDLARARQIAERAVVHINYREEQQRLDVWVAYLNMECVYGDALETVFKRIQFLPCVARAIQYNDAKKIYYQMTFIFEKAQKLEEARSACERCCFRFPESQKMWVRHLTLLYTSLKDLSAARELMLQALLRLPRRKHVAFAACCARLEYKFGSKERGQTYFEKLLAEHPKRMDLWSQYMDAHIAANTPPRCQQADLESIRLLFERSTSLQLKPRKMKFLFTRWLLFEKQHGTADGQSLVRRRAMEYIQTMEAKLVEGQQN